MTGPDIDEMVRLIAQTWQQRSPEELSRFTDQLAPPAPPPVEPLRRLHERAALSGSVAPRDLVRGLGAEEADRLLDAVLPDFDRVLANGRWLWTLRSGPRISTLTRLAASETLRPALEDAAGVFTDAVGWLLRELAGARARRAEVSVDVLAGEPSVRMQALSWASPLGGCAGELAEARRRAGVDAIRDSYAILLQYGVHGRDAELARLHSFVAAPVDADGPVPLLAVTGIGGMGKSTLLAKFIQPYLDRVLAGDATAPAVVVIDFDRMHFRLNTEIELSFELTRQLGYAAPVASADFSALRHQTREERRATQADLVHGTSAQEADATDTGRFEYEARTLIELHQLQDRPVLLVLDTFEEWQRDRPYPEAWNAPEQQITEWIRRLRDTMGLRNLRVIVSGRADVEPTYGVVSDVPVQLAELGRSAALELLAASDITGEAADALFAAVGGSPLTLLVAARFYLNLPADERDQFVADSSDLRADLDHEVRRAVLYDRFLRHIKDGRVRKLAHPGLVLRRVTPSLVRHVLAPHCGLGEISDGVAAELTERLADEVWLVRRVGDELRQQPDVRGAMLRLMSSDPVQSSTAQAIHSAAAEWYRSGSDPGLTGDAARVEWFYHTLMQVVPDGRSVLDALGEHAPTDDDNWNWTQLYAAMRTGASDFAPTVQVQLRALLHADLTDDEAIALPKNIWDEWCTPFGEKLLADEDAGRAVRLFERRLSEREDPGEPAWLARAYCETALWERYWTVSPHGRLDRYALVNACGRAGRDLDAVLVERSVAENFVYAFALLLAGRSVPHQAAELSSPNVFPVDQLRRLMVWAGDPFERGRRSPELSDLAGLFRPDPRWATACVRLTGRLESDKGIAETLGEFAASGPAKRSDELLREWARLFAAQASPLRFDVDTLVSHPKDVLIVLRGDNPELRPAIRLAVNEVVGRHGLEHLAEIAWTLLPIPTMDLGPSALRGLTGESARRPITKFVEYVDRSGVMRKFLEAARTEYPDAEVLGRTADTFITWDDLYNQAIRRVVQGLRG